MSNLDPVDQRLQRIETKLDQVSTTLSDLARIDERLVSAHHRITRHENRLDGMEVRVISVEHYQARVSGKGMLLERGGWVVFASVVAAISNLV